MYTQHVYVLWFEPSGIQSTPPPDDICRKAMCQPPCDPTYARSVCCLFAAAGLPAWLLLHADAPPPCGPMSFVNMQQSAGMRTPAAAVPFHATRVKWDSSNWCPRASAVADAVTAPAVIFLQWRMRYDVITVINVITLHNLLLEQ